MSIANQQYINEHKYWVAFSQIAKIGPVRFKKIYSHFPSMELAWSAPLEELLKSGLEQEMAEEIVIKRSGISPDAEWEKLDKEHIGLVTIKDENYPKLLKEIFNPPALLYYKGSFEALNSDYALAVVGTRKITSYGKELTPEIVKTLAQNGLTIVSGLALGIDALAHSSALEANGITVAVLGSGIGNEHIYPAENRYLAQKIASQGGAVVSEFPISMLPLKHNFPIRNRIVSGLSLGTLVIEAGLDSGALITARLALEQNREVFAVPGNIYNPSSAGPNSLLRMGAKLVTSAADILEALNLSQAVTFIETKKIIPETKEEEALLKLLSKEPTHIDKLIRESGLEAAKINSTLLMMEIKGQVRNLGGANYVLAR